VESARVPRLIGPKTLDVSSLVDFVVRERDGLRRQMLNDGALLLRGFRGGGIAP
jgi:hypothetical protein